MDREDGEVGTEGVGFVTSTLVPSSSTVRWLVSALVEAFILKKFSIEPFTGTRFRRVNSSDAESAKKLVNSS